MDLDLLFTVLLWVSGLCLVFWVGLLLAGLAGGVSEDESDEKEIRDFLARRNSPV